MPSIDETLGQYSELFILLAANVNFADLQQLSWRAITDADIDGWEALLRRMAEEGPTPEEVLRRLGLHAGRSVVEHPVGRRQPAVAVVGVQLAHVGEPLLEVPATA